MSEITFVTCPYCDGNTWIPELGNPVCDKCLPKVNADLALQSIIVELTNLENMPPSALQDRISVLHGIAEASVMLLTKINEENKK